MKTLLLFILFNTCFLFHINAQEKKHILKGKLMSGTHITDEQETFLDSHKEALKKFERPSSIGMIEIPVKIHIVRAQNEKDPLGIDEIQLAFAQLNQYFIHLYVQFVPLGDYNYIRDEKYYILNEGDEDDLCSSQDVQDVINLYIVGGIEDGPNKFCGYTHYPQKLEKRQKSIDRIIMAKDCMDDNVALARQVGHYFTLFPTAGLHMSETNEWVDGSNCEEEGDQLCDTPADPGLTLSTVDEHCGYIGRKQDQSGRKRFYKPDMHNLMSDNPRLYCCTHFTDQQYRKMMYAILNIRNYLTFPKSAYSKKQLKNLAEEKGIEGEVEVFVQGVSMTTERDRNMYINKEYTYPSSTPYRMQVSNSKKGYVYVLEGDSERGIYLQYPLKGDKIFFKGEEKTSFIVPSNDKMLKVDELKGEDGKNHIVVMFSKKQLRINDLIDKMNSIEEDLDVVQRVYTIIGDDLIPSKNLIYSKSGISVSGIATDQQIMPVVIEYLQQ